MIRTRSAVFLVLAIAPAAWAGTPINQSKAVNPDASIEITNVKGSVAVSAWDKPEVSITGTLGEGSRGLTVEGGGAHLTVKVEGADKGKKGWFDWGSDSRLGDSDLQLKVPRGASLDINVVSANVSVDEVAGRSVDVQSVSGRVRLATTAPRLRVDAVSGDVEFAGKAEDTNIQTVSGDVRVRGVGGRLHTETVSGNTHVETAQPLREGEASTVSGDIDLRSALAKGGRVHMESMSGDVRVRVPADTSARLRVESFSGTIKSDFGTVKREEFGPGSSLEERLGDGDGELSLESFSGDVTVQRD